jgi:hypothetical protein
MASPANVDLNSKVELFVNSILISPRLPVWDFTIPDFSMEEIISR